MAKFLMLGKYSVDAVKGIKSERTKKWWRPLGNPGARLMRCMPYWVGMIFYSLSIFPEMQAP